MSNNYNLDNKLQVIYSSEMGVGNIPAGEEGGFLFSDSIGSWFKEQPWDNIDSINGDLITFNNGYNKYHELTLYEIAVGDEISLVEIEQVSSTEYRTSKNFGQAESAKIRVFSFNFKEVEKDGAIMWDTGQFLFSIYNNNNDKDYYSSISNYHLVNHSSLSPVCLDGGSYVLAYNRESILIYRTNRNPGILFFSGIGGGVAKTEWDYRQWRAGGADGVVFGNQQEYIQINNNSLIKSADNRLMFTLIPFFNQLSGVVHANAFYVIGSNDYNSNIIKNREGVFIFFGYERDHVWVKVR